MRQFTTLKQVVDFYGPKVKEVKPINWDLTVISVGVPDLHRLLNLAKKVLREEKRRET